MRRASRSVAAVLMGAAVLLGAPERAQGAGPDARCRPIPLPTWRAKCSASRAQIREALSVAQKSRTFRSVTSAGEACRVLHGSGSSREQAQAELMAVFLNQGAGILRVTCCVE